MKVSGFIFLSLLMLFFSPSFAQVDKEEASSYACAQTLEQQDMQVLKDIIDLNKLNVRIEKLGRQVWDKGRLTWFALGEDGIRISKLPESFGKLSGLTHLYLSNNHLKSIPSSMGQLKELEALYLNDNALERLPESMGSLKKLAHLYLNGNKLVEIPESLGQLTQLRNLYLNDNLIEQIPASVSELPALRNLYF